jgi:hypothetical protein
MRASLALMLAAWSVAALAQPAPKPRIHALVAAMGNVGRSPSSAIEATELRGKVDVRMLREVKP